MLALLRPEIITPLGKDQGGRGLFPASLDGGPHPHDRIEFAIRLHAEIRHTDDFARPGCDRLILWDSDREGRFRRQHVSIKYGHNEQ